MKTVLITTADDLLSSFFWSSFASERKKLITKIILLPSRTDVEFPVIWKPVVAFKLLGLSGISKLIRLKYFGTKVTIESICDEFVTLTSLDPGALHTAVVASDVDVLISVGAPVVFKRDLISIPTICSLNLHNGDIIKYRGHFSTFWEIINKEERFCLTLHEMTSKVDSGVIYDQRFTSKKAAPTFLDVMIWKKTAGGQMLAKTLTLLDNKESLHENLEFDVESSQAKYYPFPTVYDVLKFRF